MAFKKTLVQRLFNLSRFSTPNVSKNPVGHKLKPDPGEKLRRVNQRRQMMSSPASMTMFPAGGSGVLEKLRGMDIARDRINLNGLIMPFPVAREEDALEVESKKEEVGGGGLTMGDVKKVLRASQVEMIRERLRKEEREWIAYSEFVEICKEACGGNWEQGFGFAKTLDDSGSVIVLGNSVCLRPHQEVKTLVAKVIQNLVSPAVPTANDPRKKELDLMEEQKAEIDQKADALVRRELWAGLGYMVVQTAAFMRLTFWELSWDVMEPICFYVTSFYFMAGYAFFLRTSKEPSFEGFFQSRFSAKQHRLMKAHNFDLERYNDLRKTFYPQHPLPSSHDGLKLIKFDDHNKND